MNQSDTHTPDEKAIGRRLEDFLRVLEKQPRMTDPSYYDLSQITPEIYIGPQYYRVGKGRLERLGIRYSINMQIEFDSASFGLALEQHCYLPTEDDEAPAIDQLRRGIDFIGKAVGDGEKVYVHCALGRGRSPTMVAAYLIDQGLAVDDAVELIRKARPIIELSPEQVEQLRYFETISR